jgi:predicted Zn-dependent protease
MLGLQYMYKTGYDPGAFVDFFEKIESLEKKKPGTISKLFATHLPTDERIVTSQRNIQEMLKERPEYVVNTSEFNDAKVRLAMLHNKRKPDPRDANRPQLRRAPGSGTPTDGRTSTGSNDRPTLKRAPGSNQQ